MYEFYACPNLALVYIIIVIIIIIVTFNNIRNAFIGRIFLNAILMVCDGGERNVYIADIYRGGGKIIYAQVKLFSTY